MRPLWAPSCQIRLGPGDDAVLVCHLCGCETRLPGDLEHRYCPRCHLFHENVMIGRRLVELGGTHDCGEWRTARHRCALCDRDLAGTLTAGELEAMNEPPEGR